MDLLHIATAGSVDDGKSTLIGRLLYETGALKDDQLAHIRDKSEKRGFDYLDFSLATDGLLTEREQGITIDVSHIYFSSASRRFVIADSPGHEEYTRNMVTGASNVQLSLILVDARKGITTQTRRHYYLSSLLGIKRIVLCVNKMDLVDYDEVVFRRIVGEFAELTAQYQAPGLRYDAVPLAAVWGVNIAEKSALTGWYPGPSLLELLEKENPETTLDTDGVMQVQYVLRPRTAELHDYRAYLGKVKSGALQVGDAVEILPSGQRSHITRLEVYGQEVERVQAGDNASILLADEVDISRGQTIAVVGHQLRPFQQLQATVCWMDQQPLAPGRKLWLQHGVNRLQARVTAIHHRVATATFAHEPAPAALQLNDIAGVTLQLAQPIYAKPYLLNRAHGAFILIDEFTNATAGVGFVHDNP